MKIKELSIVNFRGFENEKIIFSDNNFYVFIGVNGAGKTSILDLLAIFFVDWINENFEIHNFEINELKINSNSDLRKNTTKAELEAIFYPNHVFRTSIGDDELQNDSFLISFNFHKNLDTNISDTNKNETIHTEFPIFAYYQTKITIQKSKKRKKIDKKLPQLNVYQNICVFLEDYEIFAQWFKEQEDFENQEKVTKENLAYRNPPLEIVRQAIETFFGEIEKGNAVFKDLKVERQQQDTFNFETNLKTATLTIKKNNDVFSLENLSSGEKHILLLVCDIARRLSIAHPSHNPIQALKEGEGVVLIDEIEQHLHPKWQRNIVLALQKTFPSIQFIVTTHSPQVLSGVRKESVFVLDNFKISTGYVYTEQRDSNSILEDVFDVPKYALQTQRKIDDFYAFLENNLENAEKILNELTEKFGTQDLEIKRALMYLEDAKEENQQELKN